jgi:hypothetical protein
LCWSALYPRKLNGLESLFLITVYLGDMRPWINSSSGYSNTISTVLDPCHMLKLVRNAFSDLAVLRNGRGEAIKWEFLEALHHVQVCILLFLLVRQDLHCNNFLLLKD